MIPPRYWAEILGACYDAWVPHGRPLVTFYVLEDMYELDGALRRLALDPALRIKPADRDPSSGVRQSTSKQISGSRAALRAMARIHLRAARRRGESLSEELNQKLDQWLCVDLARVPPPHPTLLCGSSRDGPAPNRAWRPARVNPIAEAHAGRRPRARA